jgi:hypothetical protein
VVLGLVCVAAIAAAILLLGSGSGGDSAASTNPACTPRSARTAECPDNEVFSVTRYIGHGDGYNCNEFASQADAQAVLEADPTDPNDLDAEAGAPAADRDGVACRSLEGPRDLEPVKAVVSRLKCRRGDARSARCPQASRTFDPRDYLRHASDEFDCAAFASQADAQAVLRYQPTDPNKLDGDGDGIACPDLRAPKDLEPAATPPPS